MQNSKTDTELHRQPTEKEVRKLLAWVDFSIFNMYNTQLEKNDMEMILLDFSNLKSFMDGLCQWRIPGNSIVVYHKNKEVFRYSAGYSNLEKKIKMSGDELFNIYSCSKLATVVSALQLYEKGKFLLDDPLYEYIPEYKDIKVSNENGEPEKAKNPITLRHLFTHTSGFSYNFETDGVKELRKKTNGELPTVEVAKALADSTLLFEPGERWNYSLSHDLLGAVVEIVSGKRFEDYVKENIFEPIRVKDVFYHRNEEIKSRMAEQYSYSTSANDDIVNMQISSSKDDGYITNVGKECCHVLGGSFDSGGAGIVTSVESYAKFANVLAMGGKTKSGEQILSRGTIELLRTNQLNENQRKTFSWKQLRGYGYGLGVRTMTDKAAGGSNGSIGEFGWGGAAGATVLVDMDRELSFFYTHHMLNPQEDYYQPRLRNVVYGCF